MREPHRCGCGTACGDLLGRESFAGPRPTVAVAQPEVGYGDTLVRTVPDAAAVETAALIRPGVTTHSSELEQRLVDLPLIVDSADGLMATLPASPRLAPPGWYLLFVVSGDGVPSPGVWVHLS